jgi:hypothetical protein
MLQSSVAECYFLMSDNLPTSKELNLKANPVEIRWHPGLPIYASEEFLKSEGGEFGWVGATGGEGQLRCILPYVVIRKPGFRMIRFRTGTVPLAGELSLAEERAFLNSVVEYFRSTGADMIIPSGNHAIFRTHPDAAAFGPYGTFINNLAQSEEVLMSGIRKTFRQNIRKATAAGIQIKCGIEYLDIAYQLVTETLQRSGVKFRTLGEFKSRVLALGEYVKIFVAEHKGVIQGCMVSPYSRHTAYNCYAGSRPQPALGSMHLLHWEAMREFRAIGVKRFDFQGVRISPQKGSKQEGIMHYKQGFGGELVEGYLWKFPLRPLKSIAYSVGVRLLMGGDIVDQERKTIRMEKGNSPERLPPAQETAQVGRE